jgi:pyrroloquinoline quinone (PQQ) biosynthesis protein C
MTRTVWQRIEASRERWDVLRHPFYRRWSAGELTADDLARYSGQYRHAVTAIADASDTVAAASPEDAGLARHAAEERAHVELWDGFVGATGGSATAEATPETAACVSEWTAGDDALDHLARLYAIESGQPAISRTKHEGLVGLYGFADGPATDYFRVHASLDADHAAEARALIERLATPEDEDRVVAAAESAFRANWRLLDGV